jgi:hypothetical protein
VTRRGICQDLPVVPEDRLSVAVGGQLGGSSATCGPTLAGISLSSRTWVASDIETAVASPPGYAVSRPGAGLGCSARNGEAAASRESWVERARWMTGPLAAHRPSRIMTGWIPHASMRT